MDPVRGPAAGEDVAGEDVAEHQRRRDGSPSVVTRCRANDLREEGDVKEEEERGL